MKPVKAWALLNSRGRIKPVISTSGTTRWIGACRSELEGWRCMGESVVRVEIRELPKKARKA